MCITWVTERGIRRRRRRQGIGGGNRRQDVADSGGNTVPGACPDPAQVLLGLGEGVLDRVEIGRVRRQEDEVSPGRLDERSGFGALVHAEVVQDHDLAWSQRRDQDPFHERFTDQAVDCPTHEQTLAKSRRGQRRQPGDRLAATARDNSVRPLATWGTCPHRRKRGWRTGFIENDEISRINVRHGGAPWRCAMAVRHAARAASSRSLALRLFF